MSQVTEQSVRFQTALASIKLIQASAVLDLTEDDFDFLTSNKVWIATDRSRARRCVEACVYGTLRSEERRVGKECRRRGSCGYSTPTNGRRTVKCKVACAREMFFFSSRRRHTMSVSAFLLNRSSDLALASIKLIQASAVLDLTEDDFDFLTSNKVWIATDRSRARRCVEACVYGTLDFVGYPRFPAPVEFIAAVIAYYVHPVNIQTACLIMEGAEFTENIINGVERPVKAAELFAFTLRVRAGNTDVLTDAEENVRQKLRAEGVM